MTWLGVSLGGFVACAVCFGGEGPSAEGATASVLFLGGLTYGVIATGAVVFLYARARASETREREKSGEGESR